jgi:hypothetical protein
MNAFVVEAEMGKARGVSYPQVRAKGSIEVAMSGGSLVATLYLRMAFYSKMAFCSRML